VVAHDAPRIRGGCRQCRETRHRRNAVAAEPGLISTSHRRAIPPPRRTARAGDRARQAHRARRSRPVPSLGENVECIAVAADDVLRLRHFFLEAGIVRLEQVATLRSFDQEQRFTLPGVQTIDDLFRQDNSERVPEFADLEFDQSGPSTMLLLL
jgi:hypothetical protein